MIMIDAIDSGESQFIGSDAAAKRRVNIIVIIPIEL